MSPATLRALPNFTPGTGPRSRRTSSRYRSTGSSCSDSAAGALRRTARARFRTSGVDPRTARREPSRNRAGTEPTAHPERPCPGARERATLVNLGSAEGPDMGGQRDSNHLLRRVLGGRVGRLRNRDRDRSRRFRRGALSHGRFPVQARDARLPPDHQRRRRQVSGLFAVRQGVVPEHIVWPTDRSLDLVE
jgi:hypothetical protein